MKFFLYVINSNWNKLLKCQINTTSLVSQNVESGNNFEICYYGLEKMLFKYLNNSIVIIKYIHLLLKK